MPGKPSSNKAISALFVVTALSSTFDFSHVCANVQNTQYIIPSQEFDENLIINSEPSSQSIFKDSKDIQTFSGTFPARNYENLIGINVKYAKDKEHRVNTDEFYEND